MIQIALTECHKEANALDARNGLCQRLNFFVMQQIHVLVTDLIEGVFPLDAHCRNLNPVAVLPVAARCADFAQIDFRIEVGCKSVAVIAAVTVENINGVNLVKFVLCSVCAIRLRHARIKAAAKKCSQTCLFKTLLICPLP